MMHGTGVRYLMDKGLYRAGLVDLTPTMLVRYNECLESLGIPPTSRKKISVDGVGWSPQIARERRDPYYLCASGLVSPNIIIVSPEQYKKPVYWPIFSWMRGALRQFFERYHKEITDLTATHVFSLSCEYDLSSLEGPMDLSYLNEVRLCPNTGEIAQKASKQKELIARLGTALDLFDVDVEALCGTLKASRLQDGDLRKRRLDMQPVSFTTFRDFYTAAFHGAAVIRHVSGADLLVLESKSTVAAMRDKGGAHDDVVICDLHDKDSTALCFLRDAGMLSVPYEEFRRKPERLDNKKELLLGLSLSDCEEGLDWANVSAVERRSIMKRHASRIPQIYHELERYSAIVKRAGKEPEISQELWHFLAEPALNQSNSTQEVLWILLTHREPRRVLNLYTHDKNFFFARYAEWSPAKQRWAADYLAARYQPRMNQQ